MSQMMILGSLFTSYSHKFTYLGSREAFFDHPARTIHILSKMSLTGIKSCVSLTFSLAKQSAFLVTTLQSFVFQPHFKCRLVTRQPYCDYAAKMGVLQIPVGRSRSALDLKITIYSSSA